ncbi:MAG: excinuclease ABC subunit UvrA [Gammaproteobacteria bacterium]|nr:excinuclease ABC subunit UvrA [Gammaproteobacteria bacterium]
MTEKRLAAGNAIRVVGACQNNLQSLDIDLPLGELIVVTGVSGSGKSSLAFDTIYSEGQRRYVETFSPYARQFLDRMDKPQAERIEGIPPAIAIDQTNPVRTSRSTVGTMTELTDHLKLLFARAADLFCAGCGNRVQQDTPSDIVKTLLQEHQGQRVMVVFTVRVPGNFSHEEVLDYLNQQGYTRIHSTEGARIEVIQDRTRTVNDNRARLVEALEAAFKHGGNKLTAYLLDEQREVQSALQFSAGLHCSGCDIDYTLPIPNAFSFNSPVGACPTCRGFGRTMGIDYGLVVPDESKTLKGGAIKPWQTSSYRGCQRDLVRFARRDGIPIDRPWRSLSAKQRAWVIDGEGSWEDGVWYGARRFFEWLESRSYKMHVRVLLSKYRSYDACSSCRGARLKADALNWRLGSAGEADVALPREQRVLPYGAGYKRRKLHTLPGLCIQDVVGLPIVRCNDFFQSLRLPAPLDEATELLLGEIHSRLRYLVDVGLGYLTLDRQSRTLSGGEVQRINLTTALGTSLVNTLFVLDEPSIGLHARDMRRVIEVLLRLRDAGNSLLVVEHDADVMLAADKVLDIGPGPGSSGGKRMFFGSPRALLRSRRSLTADYLAGRNHVADGLPPAHTEPAERWLQLTAVTEHNLKNIDVDIPLQRLVCVTGVSGSGKSTLVEDVLYRALRKAKGKPIEAAGAHQKLHGHRHLDDVVLVNQTPIGKTTRSNPASYVGALDAIRRAFAATSAAQSRGYTAGTFSFNAGDGRCPTCSGNGFEHIEMQFLSDVYLRCPDCSGRRYRNEILDIKLAGANGTEKSIADVLDTTVTDALAFFAGFPQVHQVLQPLLAVGLGYLTLGQPVPTLSGGEAQRLKLAGHLSQSSVSDGAGILFLFDEPTTGLHFADIATLLRAFRALLANGHSLVVIEHNLDVIGAADWVVDLGPEGGDAGGQIVYTGTVEKLPDCGVSHTGRALRYKRTAAKAAKPASPRKPPRKAMDIRIHNAREHNLQSIDITVPRDKFTVITGVSGSGKSTVAFDILFAEGQRRYLESLNAYARQFAQPASRPEVDAIFGIPPTVAIEQRTSRGGRKSTVATMTEIYHFLRLLFVKLATQHCPDCDVPIESQSSAAIQQRIMRDFQGSRITLFAPLVVARKGYYTDLAKWAARRRVDYLRVDGKKLPTDKWPRLDRFREHDIDLPTGTLTVKPENHRELASALAAALEHGKGVVRVAGNRNRETIYSSRHACVNCGRSFEPLDPRLFSYNSKRGWCESCFGTGLQLQGFDAEQTGEESWWNAGWEETPGVCPACRGRRLRPEALAVRFRDMTIADITQLSVQRAAGWFEKLRLHGRDAAIARDILVELRSRLDFLQQVGLGYLSLDRAAPTLSGGEAQRIRLAAQLGSNLRGVCYILDEPTIGLHARDNALLLATLSSLEAKGNTVVVVEHDEDTIRRAEHIIDLGPGAGVNGGRVVAQGSVKKLLRTSGSRTGNMLAKPLHHPLTQRRGARGAEQLCIRGAKLHNLQGFDIRLPLQRLVCVTGVSGSGKSTLIREVLHTNLAQMLQQRRRRSPVDFHGCDAIDGWQTLTRILEVDQRPIGKTPRSCPATYVGIWDYVRRLFAETTEARMRDYSASRFSFNVHGGRCDACDGQGVKRIEMSFLPDVRVACEVCAGERFNSETLSVRFKDRHVGDVLAMNVDQAVDYFSAHPKVHHTLRLLQDVGLGYLTLGQPSPTLSGGEAQRIKLVNELAKARPVHGVPGRQPPSQKTLYVLDEPTIGLHMADVEKLLHVLHRLVDSGNTVVIIEHNLDVIAEADWVVDLGPEGGNGGGCIVAQGTPEAVAKRKRSHTGRALAPVLAR